MLMLFGVLQINSGAYAANCTVKVGEIEYSSFNDWVQTGYAYEEGDDIYIYAGVEVITPIVLSKSCNIGIVPPGGDSSTILYGHTDNSPFYSTVFLITAEGESAENPININIISEDSMHKGEIRTENADAIVVAENAKNVNFTLTGLIMSLNTSNGGDYSAIKINGDANVRVNACSIGDSNCDHAITVNNGSLSVNDGNFASKGDCFVFNAGENDISAILSPEDATSSEGYCLSAGVVAENSDVCNIDITGGQWHMAQEDNFNISSDFATSFSFIVTGGNFNKDETAYCTPGSCTIMQEGSSWYAFANKTYYITYEFGAEGEGEGVLSEDGISSFTARTGEILSLKTVYRPDAHFDGWFENDQPIYEIDTALVSNFHDMTLVARFTYYSASVSIDDSVALSTNRDIMLACSNIIANDYACQEYLLTATNDELLDALSAEKMETLKASIRDEDGQPVDFDNIENYSLHLLIKIEVESITVFNMIVDEIGYSFTTWVVAKAEDYSTLGTCEIEDFTDMFGVGASLVMRLPIPQNVNCVKLMLQHLEQDNVGQDFYRTDILLIQGEANAKYIQVSESVFNGNGYFVNTVQNLKTAIENAEDGAVINLESDYYLSSDVEITIESGKTITLNTCDYNIVGNGNVIFKVKGTFTINGYSSDLQVKVISAGNNACMSLERGYYSLNEESYIVEACKEYSNVNVYINNVYFVNQSYYVIGLFSKDGEYELTRNFINAPFGINLGSGQLSLGAGMQVYAEDIAVNVKQIYAADSVSLVIDDGRYLSDNISVREETTFIKSHLKTSVLITGGTFIGDISSANCSKFISGGNFSKQPAFNSLDDEVYFVKLANNFVVCPNETCYVSASFDIKSLTKYFGEEKAEEYMQTYEIVRQKYQDYDTEAVLDNLAEQAYNILLEQKQNIKLYNDACLEVLETMYYADDPELCDSVIEEYSIRLAVIESSSVYSGAINATAHAQYVALINQKEAYFTVEIPSVNLTNFVYNGVLQYYFTQLARGIIATNNARQAAGSQTVVLELEEGYHWNDIGKTTTPKEYSFNIKKADLILSNIYLLDKIVAYNGQVQSLELEGDIPSYLRYTYEGNGKVNVGTYPVRVDFSLRDDMDRNYNVPQSLSATLKILKAKYVLSGISFVDKSYDCDGRAKYIYIEGSLPEGVSVRYTNNGKVEAGNHIVTAYFDLSDELARNYESPTPISAHLVILSSMTESISTWAFIAIIAGVIMIVLGMLLLLALKKREE